MTLCNLSVIDLILFFFAKTISVQYVQEKKCECFNKISVKDASHKTAIICVLIK